MKRIVLSIAAVAGGLWLISASALGLGEINVRSHLNQRFDAVIPLTSVGVDEAADLRVSLASTEDFARAGLDRSDYLSSLHFAVRTDGTPRIEISSDKLEREPYLQLLLEIRGGGNRILRQYTVLLDPAGMAQNSTQAAVTPRPVTALPVAPTAVAVAPIDAAPAPAQIAGGEPTQSIFVEVDHPAPPPDERSVAPRSEPVKSSVKPKSPADTTLAASASTTSTAPVSGELYGPVKPGETLWSIATRVRGDNADVSMDQVLLSLYNGNPRAFDGGGINGLSRGAMLSIPAVADMRTLDATDAHREVSRLRGLPAGAAARAAMPRARKPVIEPEPAQITPPPPPAVAAAQAIHSAPAAPIVNAKPADAETAAAPATDNDKPADADQAATSTPAPVDATQASAGDAVSSESVAADAATAESTPEAPSDTSANAPQVTVPPVEPVQPVKTKKTESLLQALLIPLILGLLLLFFVAWLFARWRARRAAMAAPPPVVPPRPRMPLSTPSTSEAAIAAAAAVAATTTQKLTPQEELDRLQASISGRTQDIDTQQFQTQQLGVDAATTTEVAAPAGDLPPVDFDLTGQFATQTVQIDLDANDPVSEADFHLAYGLYDEAALLLRQAAEKEPQRTDIGIKLAETYFAAGKTAEFVRTATELKPKLSAVEWQKLAIMGQQLDPTSTAFGDAESAPLKADLDPAFGLDATAASTPAESVTGNAALDFNFDGEPAVEPVRELPPSVNLQADNGLDFKLDDLELPSLDVDKHDAPAAPPVADSNALDFDLGGFDVAAAPAAAPGASAAEPIAHDASSTLDFDLGDFDVGAAAADASKPLAVEPTADAPIEEFDFDAVSTEAGELVGDEAATKLDLARAYLEMGDSEMARGLLDEVLEQGNAQQKQDAQSLVDRLT